MGRIAITRSPVLRFGVFEVDLRTGELRKKGQRLRLPGQSFQVLQLLLERPGELVSREELREKIWGTDTFVDLEHGLNAAVNRLREALGDSADSPRFIETLPRRGYRFIAPLQGAENTPVGRCLGNSSGAVPQGKVVKSRLPFGIAPVGVLLLLVTLGAIGFSFYRLGHADHLTRFSEFSIVQVTNSGKARWAALSPDARYLASVIEDNGMESLNLRNVPTNSDTEVIPPAAVHYESLMFSPDGNYLYYRKAGNATRTEFDLYRTPVLGGHSQMVVHDVDSDISFSPDGRRIVYARGQDPDVDKYHLISANIEGEQEEKLQEGSFLKMPFSPAWSPNGREVVYEVLQPNHRSLGGLQAFDLFAGTTRTLARFDNKVIDEIRWLPDGRGLIAVYREGWFSPAQIGTIELPKMITRPITRDTNFYSALTLSFDGKSIATVQRKLLQTLSITTESGSHKSTSNLLYRTQIVAGPSSVPYMAFDWVTDTELLLSDPNGVVRISSDSKKRFPIIDAPGIGSIATCGTQYLLLQWAFHNRSNTINIWRTDANGLNPVQLTNGSQDWVPVCSGDYKWVYYANGDTQQLRRVPVNGGESELVTRGEIPNSAINGVFGISPDGKLLAYPVIVGNSGTNQKILVLNISSASQAHVLEADPRISGRVQFTPDSKAIAYPIRERGVDDIWIQPLTGSSPARKITDFKSEQIVDFHWSPDGKALGVIRSLANSDVVLIKEKD